MMWFDDTRSSTDYDAVWDVRTQIHKDGWSAEFRIPFSQLRFSITPGEPVVWGFNIRRDIVYNAEMIRWVATPRGAQGFVSRFGHLTFAKPPAAPRRLEVQPFTLARQERVTGVGNDHDATVGLDFRMGLGTATTLSAAVNPDFGQVEQDPAVLEPERVRDVPPGEAAVLHRGQPDAGADVPAGDDVSLAPHRPAAGPVRDSGRRDGDRAAGCDDDSWRHQGHRQGQRLDLRRPDGTDRSRVRARGNGGRRARRAADRALHLLQRRARAERHSRRLVEHRRPRHGGAAREAISTPTPGRSTTRCAGAATSTPGTDSGAARARRSTA